MISDVIELLKQELEKADGGRLLPATKEDLKQAEQFGFPNVLLDFYREHAPDAIDGRVELWKERPASGYRIWSVQNAITESRDYVPGSEIFPLGYVVFASNMFGDAYCIDTVHVSQSGDLSVVLFPHDEFAEGASLEGVERYRLTSGSQSRRFLAAVCAQGVDRGAETRLIRRAAVRCVLGDASQVGLPSRGRPTPERPLPRAAFEDAAFTGTHASR
jgi:hypothetical protein